MSGPINYIRIRLGIGSPRQLLERMSVWTLVLTLALWPAIAKSSCCCQSQPESTQLLSTDDHVAASASKTCCCCPSANTKSSGLSNACATFDNRVVPLEASHASCCDCDPLECMARLPDRVSAVSEAPEFELDVSSLSSSFLAHRDEAALRLTQYPLPRNVMTASQRCSLLCCWRN